MHTIHQLEPRRLLAVSFAYGAAFGDFETLDSGNAVVVDAQGNTYFAGTFRGKIDVDRSNRKRHFLKSFPDTHDAFLVKYDPTGKLLWSAKFGEDGDETIDHLVIGPNGDLYASGQFQEGVDFDPGPGVQRLNSHGQLDAFILHLTEDGDFVWAGNIGGERDDNITALAVGPSGDIYYSGYVRLRGDADPTRAVRNIIDRGVDDTIIARLNGASGAIKWMKVYGENATRETVMGLAVDANENVLAAGVFNETVQFDRKDRSFDREAVGSDDIYLARLDSGGKFQSIKTIGGKKLETVANLISDDQGNLYLTGNFAKTVDFDPGRGKTLLAAPGDGAAYVMKLGSDANLTWARAIGPAVVGGNSERGTIVARAIGLDVNGAVYTVGDFFRAIDFDPGSGLRIIDLDKSNSVPQLPLQIQPSDTYVHKLDADGKFVEVHHFGGEDGTVLARDLAVDPGGAINIVGAYAGFVDLDPTSGLFRRSTHEQRGDSNVFLIKLLP
ncbi:MAG TPA: hypothetical protein VGQ99_06830 [Tepidisphaeraceae bacterium]|jgi:hypothetical protein|nr:hypothetical protein [Tepidisphaeraceae bacterium]